VNFFVVVCVGSGKRILSPGGGFFFGIAVLVSFLGQCLLRNDNSGEGTEKQKKKKNNNNNNRGGELVGCFFFFFFFFRSG
jgi:hypothetical protein